MVSYCQACGHPMQAGGQPLRDLREGIWLTPMKTRIFDLIKARPGISRKDLAWLLYESVNEARLLTVGSHVKQLRDKYLATDLYIHGTASHGYRIRRRKAVA